MTTSIAYPGAKTIPGSPTAKVASAAAVITLAAAISASALVAGIATGSALDSPAEPQAPVVATVTTQAEPVTRPMTTTSSGLGMGGPAAPLEAN